MYHTQPKCETNPSGYSTICEDRIVIRLERRHLQNGDILSCTIPQLKTDIGNMSLKDFLQTRTGTLMLNRLDIHDGQYESIIFHCTKELVPMVLTFNQLLKMEDIHTMRSEDGEILHILDKNELQMEVIRV